MPRRARIMLAGVPVHVIQRGNNRGPCFVKDEDRNFYLFHLARGLGRFGCRLHAYCFSTAGSERLEEIRAATNGGYALGDELFRMTMARALGRRVEKGRPGRPLRDAAPGDSQEELPLPPGENVVCP